MLPKNLFNEVKKMIFQFTSSQRTDIAALQASVVVIDTEWTEVVVDITSAQILTLQSIPIQLLPAPGVGKYYEYFGKLEYTYNGIDYTTVGGDIYITTNPFGETQSFIDEFLLKYGSDQIAFFSSFDNVNQKNKTYQINNALNLGIIGGDPTGGNGTLKVKIKYKIETFG